jgi:hypothetical protein
MSLAVFPPSSYYWAQQHVAKLGMGGIGMIISSFDSGKGTIRHTIAVRRGNSPMIWSFQPSDCSYLAYWSRSGANIPGVATLGIKLDYRGYMGLSKIMPVNWRPFALSPSSKWIMGTKSKPEINQERKRCSTRRIQERSRATHPASCGRRSEAIPGGGRPARCRDQVHGARHPSPCWFSSSKITMAYDADSNWRLRMIKRGCKFTLPRK